VREGEALEQAVLDAGGDVAEGRCAMDAQSRNDMLDGEDTVAADVVEEFEVRAAGRHVP
jgi:hypothetical protein